MSLPGANGKYTVKWDNLKKDAILLDGNVAEVDIMVPQFKVSSLCRVFGTASIWFLCGAWVLHSLQVDTY